MTNFTEVSKDDFWEKIHTLKEDVTVSLLGNYPYTSEFVTRAREVRGRKVGYIPEGKALAKYRYYWHTDYSEDPLSIGKQKREREGEIK